MRFHRLKHQQKRRKEEKNRPKIKTFNLKYEREIETAGCVRVCVLFSFNNREHMKKSKTKRKLVENDEVATNEIECLEWAAERID